MNSNCNREDVLAALRATLATEEFTRSDALSRLLEYVVRGALEGREEGLKEYNLGVDVFHRGADFDPRLDNIVRVQARKLRLRLAEYYRTPRPGVRIEMARGSYVPVFHPIEAPKTDVGHSSQLPEASETAVQAGEVNGNGGRSRLGFWGTIGVLTAAGFLAGFVLGSRLEKQGEDLNVGRPLPLVLTPLVSATGDPLEVRTAALVSQMARERLSRLEGIRIVQSLPAQGFTIEGSGRRTGDRITLQIGLSGGATRRRTRRNKRNGWPGR